jgi:hypothetical protein
MNLVGKIFTILILVMSVFFSAGSLMVYSAHKNWREVVLNDKKTADKDLGLKIQLENAKNEKKALEDDKSRLETELTTEIAALRQARTKLESENLRLNEEKKQLTDDHDKIVDSERKAVGALQATQTTAAALRSQVDTFMKDAETARADRDAAVKKAAKATDEMQESVNEAKRLKDRGETLSEELAKLRDVVRRAGLNPNVDPNTPPREAEGHVVAIRANDLVEINIGSDDGLTKGNRLMIYRVDGTYLGQVEVVEVRPSMAVCHVDPLFRKGAIQEGDRVAPSPTR